MNVKSSVANILLAELCGVEQALFREAGFLS